MILNVIVDYTKIRVSEYKKEISFEEMKKLALSTQRGDFRFEKELRKSSPSLICEVKKASPSKGIISKDFPYLKIAKEYEKCGATCISVLTEPKYFLGSDSIFTEIRKDVNIPMLRKDFIIDEYQIYQSKVMGADCILLIASLLSQSQIEKYLNICDDLGICSLVETHNKEEIEMCIKAKAKIIGVNNRNLNDFSVNLNNATNLKKHVPSDVIFVAESGITTTDDGINLIKNGAHSLLIGEALMKAKDIKSFIETIKEYNYE